MNKQTDSIYRFALPSSSGKVARRRFRKSINAIQQLNPSWELIPDWTQSGEQEAFVLFFKDNKYPMRRVAYDLNVSLSRAFAGVYED